MGTGFRGAFVISWSQTEVDGLAAAPVQSLTVGSAWSWRGDLVRVDGPNEVLRLERGEHETVSRKCAAKLVRRLVRAARTNTTDLGAIDISGPLRDCGFVVTNGVKSYTVTIIEVGAGAPPLLMFVDDIPPRDTDMWVVHHSLAAQTRTATGPESGGIICFTPGTRIDTPDGPKRVEDLLEGDRVRTKDNGDEEIQWIGSRRMSGARLFAMPHLRPVRIRAGALGVERPDEELLVSPEHRMLVEGDVARALFNTSEVLVSARDLINGNTVAVDLTVREVTYIHLLLPRHQILWANGVETESFHPASASLTALNATDRERLLKINPYLELEPQVYGDYARRNLTASEAAILKHEAA
ncbi:Hint domain-containing protein [Roseovarius aestuariivivens]|uniref:Hint domain-containing protein n=1 Tax=Roseovarius aestuariivivens TaxID=1888910 RepID=UPI001081B35B|nr:Hint domain-containing protein [Roseovarius aestuariivivens]